MLISQKKQILSRLKEGEKQQKIADEYGISKQQVSDIKRKQAKNLEDLQLDETIPLSKRKRLKGDEHEKLDQAC